MLDNNIVTTDLLGGLGNQLFQIAVAYTYARKLNKKLVFQTNQFSGCSQGSHPSKYYNNLYHKLIFNNNLDIHSFIPIQQQHWCYYDIHLPYDDNKNSVHYDDNNNSFHYDGIL